jgi:hypothetical protein
VTGVLIVALAVLRGARVLAAARQQVIRAGAETAVDCHDAD